MGKYTVERVLGSETDRRLGFSGAQICRPVSLLSGSWTRIRIGARLAVNATSGAMNPAAFFIGLVSDPAHAWASDYCSHAVGAYFSLSAFTNTTNGCSMGFGYFTKRVIHATTTLNATALVNVTYNTTLTLTNTTVRNCAMVLELTKKAGDIWAATLSAGRASSTSTYGDQAASAVFDALCMPSMSEVDTHLGTTGGTLEREAAVGAVSESTDGTLTSVCLFWKNPTYPLEVCDISVSRIE